MNVRNEKSFFKIKIWAKIVVFFALVVLVTGQLFSQQQNQAAAPNQQAAKPGNKAVLVDKVLNDFENAEDWRAFSTSPLEETRAQKRPQRGPIEDNYDPKSLTDEERRLFIPGENNVLGVKGFFKDRGFDRIEVKPPHEYIIKGIGRQLSVWVLGRNYRHTLYVKFKDFAGKIYKLRMGRLDFFGWRKMTVVIPGWLRQSVRFSLFNKNLKFVSFFVESDTNEVGGTFYFYLDQLSIKIDRTGENYPGNQIKDLW